MPPHHPYLNQSELIRKVRSQFQTADAPNHIEMQMPLYRGLKPNRGTGALIF